eukprot:m.107932 g.107932  ORF g.107932 m.107932 type:complete len:102 (-) comp51713_c0_seq14:399-704(-)
MKIGPEERNSGSFSCLSFDIGVCDTGATTQGKAPGLWSDLMFILSLACRSSSSSFISFFRLSPLLISLISLISSLKILAGEYFILIIFHFLPDCVCRRLCA